MAPTVKLSLLGLLATLLPLARGDNPIIQTIYTADPAPLVYNNRVYLFVDHDNGVVGSASNSFYNMTDWHLFSSADMVNWQDHGMTMSLSTFSWAKANAWAGQVINRNGQFYYYAPMQNKDGSMAVGVATSPNVTGPYKDALGKPLVENNEIDPTVFIDPSTSQAYLYWGNPDLYYVKLNTDMLSYSGSPTKVTIPTGFQEAPWLMERNGNWYMVYAGTCCSENIRYAMSSSPTGPWNYKGVVMPTQGGSFTNHEGIIDFMGNSYFFYHNGALPGGGGYTRSTCVEQFTYNSDGTIPTIQMTTTGAPQIGTLDPYVRQEAETMAFSNGVRTEVCSEGGMDVSYISSGSYIKVKGVAFGSAGATSFSARVASGGSGGTISLRLGSTTGTLIGTCTVAGTGDWQTWATVTCAVSGATGTKDLFFVFGGSGSGYLFNFDWWQFAGGSGTTSSSSTAAPAPPPSTSNVVQSSTSLMTTTTTTTSKASTTSAASGACQTLYGQCGGIGWSGPTCCASGTCSAGNAYYSQCLS
jgi:arabinoxylan arabinofuranohydrolase